MFAAERRPAPGGQRGMTLVEALLVVGIIAVVVTAVAAYSVPMIARERMRSAVRDVQSLTQLARIEAVKRNRPVRFVLDRSSGRLQVWDGNWTPAETDDALLRERRLPGGVALAAPDGGPPVSLKAAGADRYETRFAADGTVAEGTGSVSLYGAGRFERVTVLRSGTARLAHWNGAAWSDGDR